MEITLAIFYYAYLVMVGMFFIFSFFIIYHLIRFGYFGLGSLVMVGVYIFVSLMILAISWQYISEIDWQQPIEITTTLNYSL